MSQPDQPSSPALAEKKLLATLSEASSVKITDSAREELHKAVEARHGQQQQAQQQQVGPPSTPTAQKEVTEATQRFTDGVDVITETLILILGKFKGIMWRTNVGMAFGAGVLLTSLFVAVKSSHTAVIQQENVAKMEALAAKVQEAMGRLDKIQASTNATEQKVDSVKIANDQKPSIEIVPDKARPGAAKLVIRSAPGAATPPPPPPPAIKNQMEFSPGFGSGHGRLGGAHASAPKPAAMDAPAPAGELVEIPIPLQKAAQ